MSGFQYDVFFVPISLVSPAPTEYFRCIAKTSNQYGTYATMDFIFKYMPDSNFTLPSGNRMILFHLGSGSSAQGVAIVLYNNGGSIQVGMITKNTNGNWFDETGTFYTLPDITKYYHVLAGKQRNSPSSYTIWIYVTEIPITPIPSTYDFGYTATRSASDPGNSSQWGIGCPPQTISPSSYPNGYINDNSYNCYVAQNLAVNFMRTWNGVVNTVSTGYRLFTSGGATGVYNIDEAGTFIPVVKNQPYPTDFGTGGYVQELSFQLNAFGITSLADLKNSAQTTDAEPDGILVTLASTSTSYSPLSDFAVNDTVGFVTLIPNDDPFCILRGTKILTPKGYVLIEQLRKGDHVITHDKREVAIQNILNIHYHANDKTIPYKIRKGQFGAEDDVWVSPWHSILCDNEFIPVYKIPNLYQDTSFNGKSLQYFHIQLEDYLKDTLVCSGVITESWGGYLPSEPESYEYYKGTIVPILNTRGFRMIKA